MMDHAKKARQFLSDDVRADWQDKAVWAVRQKRDLAVESVEEWEAFTADAREVSMLVD